MYITKHHSSSYLNILFSLLHKHSKGSVTSRFSQKQMTLKNERYKIEEWILVPTAQLPEAGEKICLTIISARNTTQKQLQGD